MPTTKPAPRPASHATVARRSPAPAHRPPPARHRPLRIGDVARATGLSVPAIRYYETQGLVAPLDRSPSGYREFDDSAVQRIRFVQRAQALGFSLDEARELLELRRQPRRSAAEVRARVDARIGAVEAKLRELEALRDALQTLRRKCTHEHGLTGDCPILEALAREEAPRRRR
jgi:MerR family transcriptional regulator, copper efflux regulator